MLKDWRTEWARLNPRYVQEGDSLGQRIAHTAKESWHAYFAPLWFLQWVVRTSIQSLRT